MEHAKSAGTPTEVCCAAAFDSPDSKMRGQTCIGTLVTWNTPCFLHRPQLTSPRGAKE
jgi:hypothetical protein